MAKELDLSGFDEEVAKESKSSKDLDLSGFDQEMSVPQQDEKPQLSEALLRKGGQGLTFGFMDEGVAATQAGLDVATSDKKLSDLHKLYQTYKDLQNEREQQVEQEYPKVSMGAEIAGSIPTAFTGLGAANTLGKAVKLGGLYGLGKSDADLTSLDPNQLGQAAIDTTTGSALGYGGYKVAPLIGKAFQATGIPKLFQKAGQNLESSANKVNLKSLNVSRKDLAKEKGITSSADVDFEKGIAEEAYKHGNISGGPEQVRRSASERISQIEDLKSPLIEQAHQELQTVKMYPTSQELENLSQNSLSKKLKTLKDSLIEGKQSLGLDTTALENKFTSIENALSSNDNNILALNKIKKNIDIELGSDAYKKMAQDLPEQAEFLKRSRSLIRNRIEELADKVGPELGQKIKKLNAEESNLLDLREIAFNTETKPPGSSGNVGDYLAGGAGAAAGSAIAGPWGTLPGYLLGVGAKKSVEHVTGWDAAQLARIATSRGISGAGKMTSGIGNQMVNPNTIQTGLRSTAETMKPLEMSQKAYAASAEELSGAAQKLMTNPQFQTYGKALQDALTNKDPEKKNAVIFTILQNPKMRSFLNGQ